MPKPTQNTAIEDRLLQSAVSIHLDPGTARDAVYMHSVLCQVFLPLRNPGDKRIWQREQGRISLAVQGLKVLHPKSGEWVLPGLPYGPKARLILSHISTQAILTQSPVIEVESSITAFTNRLGLSKDGRTIRTVKDQLTRLSAAVLSFAYRDGERSLQLDTKPIREFDLWMSKTDKDQIMTPSVIRLGDDFFSSLLQHAIPLDIRALASLSHNARALDLYAWLAQRLHKIPPGKENFISWQALIQQFALGYDYKSGRKELRKTFKIVKTQYPEMKVEDLSSGIMLCRSRPPISPKSCHLIAYPRD